ncbi:MAG: cyclic nucleotide-binding domain-containing protein [Spirochaetales bacterium]|nr:cyclic nucleotide-binding domain-containing protein [Spirochaetales bacterium]
MIEIDEKSTWRAQASAVTTFKYLNPKELDTLLENSSIMTYEDGETIVCEREITPYFYAILDGSVCVSVAETSQDGDSKDVYICTLGPGDAFGEAGIFIKVKRTATVRASGEATILRLHRDEISAFMRSQPSGGNKLLLVIIYSLLRKLRAANQELAYERKDDIDQADVDNLLAEMMGN